MPTTDVKCSLDIQASPETVFHTIANFATWQTWSPWLGIEPSAKLTISDDPKSVGSTYHWDGEIVGTGKMIHQKLVPGESIDCDLEFTKPFRSSNKVSFTFDRVPAGTKVTWRMGGRLPWFLFWMKPMLENMIDMDYHRGLMLIKDLIENGSVTSTVALGGIEHVEARQIVGATSSCRFREINSRMTEAMNQIVDRLGQAESPGEAASAYLPSSKFSKQQFDFTTGWAVKPGWTSEIQWDRTNLPAGNYLRLTHTGPYRHLGNAWSGAYAYARAKKIKLGRSASYEIYPNDPADTPEDELITEIYVPTR